MLRILFIPLPLPCPRRHQLQRKSKGAFVSHPLAEQSLHPTCIGCIEMIHFDILDMKRYDFLMQNMGSDVLCTSPPPNFSIADFLKGGYLPKFIPELQPFV